MSAADTATETASETPAAPSENALAGGADEVMIEVDGQLVPNYDATMVVFDEGDVVSGAVVRIDQDEV